MPKSDYPSRHRDSRPELTPTDKSARELGLLLRQHSDVVILGENHKSQAVIDRNADIFKGANCGRLFTENPRSEAYDINHPGLEGVRGVWGTNHTVKNLALAEGIRLEPVDREHCKSEKDVRLFTFVTRQNHGELAAMRFAMISALEESALNGFDFRKYRVLSKQTVFQASEKILEIGGDSISEFNRRNVRDTVNDAKRSLEGGAGKAMNQLDRWFTSTMLAMTADTDERDRVMADNIAAHLKDVAVAKPKGPAAFCVGSDHNDGVEKALESKGYQAANIKALATGIASEDGKVYWNPHPGSKDRAEWVVVSYDPKSAPETRFEAEYRVGKPTATALLPTELPSSNAGSRSKESPTK